MRRIPAAIFLITCLSPCTRAALRAVPRLQPVPTPRYFGARSSGRLVRAMPRLHAPAPSFSAALRLPAPEAGVPTPATLPADFAPARKLNVTAAPLPAPQEEPRRPAGGLINGLSGWENRSRTRTSSRALGELFEGRAAPPDDAADFAETDLPLLSSTQRRSLLHRLAAPWTTREQLDRLKAEPPGESFEFAVIGDADLGRFWFARRFFNKPGVFQKQLADIAQRRVDFVVQLGDMVSRAKVSNFIRFFGDLAASGLKRPYLPVIGNHDRRKPHGLTNSELYRSLFGKTNYAFDRGGARFVVLDTSGGRLTQAQLKWLDMVLRTAGPKLIFTHMPPITDGIMALTTPALRFAGFRKGAERFTELAALHRVDRVYFGHLHGFGTLDYLGVRYVLTGGGGSPLFPGPWIQRFHHYLTVRIGPDGIVDTLHKLRNPQ